jgi:hypothetical protein
MYKTSHALRIALITSKNSQYHVPLIHPSHSKLIINPLPDNDPAIGPIKLTPAMLPALPPDALKHIAITGYILSFALHIIIPEIADIAIVIGKGECAKPILHALKPLPIVLGTRHKGVLAEPMDLVLDEKPVVFLAVGVRVDAPAILLVVLDLAFVHVAVVVRDAVFVVAQRLFQHFVVRVLLLERRGFGVDELRL